MKLFRIFCLIGITFNFTLAHGQFLQKSISIGVGPVYNLPPNPKYGTNAFGPGFCIDFGLGKSIENNIDFQFQLSKFKPFNDTIFNDNLPDGFPKVVDLEGWYSQLAFGTLWQRNFRKDYKNQIFIALGGLAMWHKSEFSGLVIYSPSDIPIRESFGSKYFTFNLSCIGGMQQKLSDNFSLFQKVQLNYQLTENMSDNFCRLTAFSEGHNFLYLHLFVGCKLDFGK
jgi:hypothetical protein